MFISHCVAAGLALAASPLTGTKDLDVEIAPSEAVDQSTIADEIAIRTDEAHRMTVPVSLSGRGPYLFLDDTGSERTVISRELAHTVGEEHEEEIDARGGA